MAEPQDKKPEQPVSAPGETLKNTAEPAKTPAEVAKTSGEQAGKTAKTDAAARIMERLQKAKTAAPAGKTDAATTPAPKPKPVTEKAQPRPFQEITLTGDLAKLGEALRQKLLKEQDVVDALLAQSQSEGKGSAQPICDILQQRKLLSAENIKQLQSVSELKLPLTTPLPKATPVDLLIGNQLMQQNLLPREAVQRILRLQATLHKLALPITLETLLQASNALPADTIKSMLDGLRKGVEEKKKQAGAVVESAKAVKRRTALRSGDSKPWPVLRWGSVAVLVLLAGVFLLVKLTPSRTYEKPRPQIELPQVVTPPVVQPNKPVRKPRVVSEVDPEELLAKQMDARGMARWGNHWIPKQQYEELAKRWQEGEKPENLSLELSAYRVGYGRKDGKPEIWVQGKMGLPALPRGLFLNMEMQLLHAFQDGTVYAEARFALTEDHAFEVTIADLPKPLEPGLYFLRLTLTPERQNEFLKDFLGLQQRQNLLWWIPFNIGNAAQIEKHIKNRRAVVEEQCKTIWECYQKLQQLSQKDAGKIRRDWETWSAQWHKNMLAIAQKIQDDQGRGLIPLFPGVNSDLPQLLPQLSSLFQLWDNWQRDFTQKQLPDLSERQAEFELHFDKLALAFKNECEKLVQLCKDTKANEAAEGN